MWQSIKNIYHLFVAVAACVWYGFPGRKLTIIGVTGTDGKTTTASLIYHILKTNGYPVSLVSTVSAVIHGKSYDTGFHVTNPAPFALQRFLAKAVKMGDKYLVLEVTSHGIDQKRVWGIPFALAVLTNISHEHLDYHKTYEKYVATKTRLLNMAKKAIINQDDVSYALVQKYLTNKHVLLYSSDMSQDIIIPKHFLGTYNAYNAYAAFLVCKELGLTNRQIENAMQSFIFPKGRGEIVYKNDFTVMVDFAHTPHSFGVLLPALKKQTKGRLIHVFGSAGLRDETKRPMMGKVASEYDDVVILTSEDPRSEKPEDIIDAIEKGMKKKKGLEVMQIVDRKKAIEKAISMARKGDFVVATGKAHEQSMNYGKGEESWDEFEVIQNALKRRS
ncbi:MAG TPA: UDP-N-acetylmuramoyl-L-alanyl-D-glutamate--2,6-diaminopimelate ligase [Patescibacteria group bacterium]|nr:UDP-N-acetylmuramoyl-L-alanyl-D-glutamate--2,6-diaminopimelate ligase [Patescibacteria group bacterium]